MPPGERFAFEDARLNHPAESRKKPLILIIDDTEMIREMARDALEGVGFEVVTAQNGREGLGVFVAREPDLVVLDVVMPGMDGLEVCEQIRRTAGQETTPVVMITGNDDRDSIRAAYDADATDFVPKPVNWNLLSSRIPYMLRMRNLITELGHSEERLAKAQRIAKLGNWELDLRADLLTCSEELRGIYGIGAHERTDTFNALLSHMHPDDREIVRHALERAIEAGEPLSVDHRISLRGVETRYVHLQADVVTDDASVVGLEGAAQDITERKQAEEQIRYLAYHDSLTRLGNRRLFTERLRHSLAQARRSESILAVLFLDLDHFKRINDTLGHGLGDELLREVADRLKSCIRETDFVSRAHDSDLSSSVSRFGGDEFMISLCSVNEPEEAAQVARRILDAIAAPCCLDGQEVVVSASVGIALYPGDADEAEALIRNADVAMYAAKSRGRAGYCFYERTMNEVAQRNLKLETDLRTALDRGALHVHYQPKVSIRSGRITGFEALARWEHPEIGTVSPGVFIPVAERAGLVSSVGEFVLRTACAQVKQWRQMGLPSIRMSVNLSAHQFKSLDVADVVEQIIKETPVSPRSIDVEITETAMMQHTKLAVEVLQRLKGIGVTVSLDDFGTGYSSLSYLKQFPVDTVKIDRSFISELTTDRDDAAITAAIISMAKSLNLKIVAEGVETEEQLEILRSYGCHEIQGYLFSPPVPADEATRLLGDNADLMEDSDATNTSPSLPGLPRPGTPGR